MKQRPRSELDKNRQRANDQSFLKDYYALADDGGGNWKYNTTQLCALHKISRPTISAILKRNGIKR